MKKLYLSLLLLFIALLARAQEDNKKASDATIPVVIPSTVDVSTLGGATYSIPVQVPGGINMMQPDLSIVYNNQSGNGLLGYEWTLGGLSAITRTGTTWYHDDYLHGVNFCNNFLEREELDRFSLDGQRLMVVNGFPDGYNGTEYRTEIDNMTKIVSYSCDTTFGPAYFVAWLANGNTAYYGTKQYSRIGLQQRNDVCMWLLDSVIDRDGNYMAYRYCKGGANYFLTEILYTGNNRVGTSPSYKVKFEYVSRPDEETVFIGNNALHQSKILKTVSVINTMSAKSQTLWQYDFTYLGGYGSDLYKRLNEIILTGGGESCCATKIYWGIDNEQFTSVAFSYSGDGVINHEVVKFAGDFNGDGYTDIITAEKNAKGSYKTARVYLNERSDQGEIVFRQIAKYTLDDNVTWIYVADFDGDGLDDFMFVNRQRKEIWWLRDIVTLEIRLSRKTGDGEIGFIEYASPSKDYRLASSKRDAIIMGDFLGEGKTSFIIEISSDKKGRAGKNSSSDTLEPRKDRSYYIRFDKGEQAFIEDQIEYNPVLRADIYYPADYNGDGKTEILYSYQQNGYKSTAIVELFKKEGYYGFEQICNSYPTDWTDCFPGDFNGDGKMDALFHFDKDHPEGEWRVYLFKQNTFLWKNYFCWDWPKHKSKFQQLSL